MKLVPRPIRNDGLGEMTMPSLAILDTRSSLRVPFFSGRGNLVLLPLTST